MQCAKSGQEVCFKPSSMSSDNDGLEITLKGLFNLRRNIFFHTDWESLILFFENIAASWKGWKGADSFE